MYKNSFIPTSRYSRVYDIADEIAYRLPKGDRMVALVGILTPGFEGLDRRMIAVPLAYPNPRWL